MVASLAGSFASYSTTEARPRLQPAVTGTPLEIYLREINLTPLLTAAQERSLSERVRQGDPNARDQMVRANLRLVVSIARAFLRPGLDLQDLIAEGNLGLLRAVEKFDPGMNTRFSTYASYWIRQSITRSLQNTAKTIRIPSHMLTLLSKWRQAAAHLRDKLGRSPTTEEIAQRLKLSGKKLRTVKKALYVCNLSPTSDTDENGWPLGDVLTDENAKAPDQQMDEAEEKHRVLSMVEQLQSPEATVLRLRFGLEGEEPHTLKMIGERLSLTCERVRQIEMRALRKLGAQFQNAG